MCTLTDSGIFHGTNKKKLVLKSKFSISLHTIHGQVGYLPFYIKLNCYSQIKKGGVREPLVINYGLLSKIR